MYGFERIEVRLHGNMIWRWSEAEDMAEFTLAGWNTVTTKSHLRALGVNVSGGVTPKLNGIAIDSDKWYEIRKRVYVVTD